MRAYSSSWCWVHDVVCRATAGLKYPSLPKVPCSLGSADPSRILFALIKIKLLVLASADQPSPFSLWHPALQMSSQTFFSSLLSNSACLRFHVSMLACYSSGVMTKQNRDVCRLRRNVELNEAVYRNGMWKCRTNRRPKGKLNHSGLGRHLGE